MSFFKKLGNFLVSRAFLINFLLVIVFWIVLIWGSLRYFDNYTNKGESVIVPTLLENNMTDIPELLSGLDLKYEVVDSIYNPNLVEGTVIYQDPMPTDSTGVSVKKDRTVKVRVSKQSRLVEVPDVISRSQRFAEASLAAKGLRTKIKYVPSIEDQGSVIGQKFNSQDVESGMKIPINSVIELEVGERSESELLLVPDLTGLTIKEAEDRLGGGKSLRLFSVCSDCIDKADSLKAKVVRQTPVAGDSSKIPAGATITIFAKANNFELE